VPNASSRRRSLPAWAFGLTLAVLTGGALTGYVNAHRLIANERLVAHSDDALLDLNRLLSALRDAERSQRGYLLTGNEAQLQSYRDDTTRVHSEIAALARQVDANPAQRGRLGTLRRQIGLKLAELERTIALEEAGDAAGALAIVRAGAGGTTLDEIQAQVAAMRTAEYALLQRRAGQSERSSDLAIAAIVAPTLIGALLLGLVFFLGQRGMKELEEADRQKDEFLALLAHELRGPLAPLRNGLELIKQGGGAEELRRRACTLMERQLEQLIRMIDDLLDASRIARGKIELRLTSIELGALLRETLELKRPQIAAAHLELDTELPSLPLFVAGDPMRLTQVFRNLLDNARKYTEAGGRIQVRLAPEHGEAVARVKDSGVGIPADKLEAIFEMFVQINRSASRSQGGLGIGLGLTKRLLELHGGAIEVFSDGPGRGSEFVVRLPLAAQEHGHVAAAPAETNGASATAT
jgi:signal transduction histidine kinase